ncbi:hypothetical protein FOMPIDRAFT_1024779, partial [Fomitopsis schrenkii]
MPRQDTQIFTTGMALSLFALRHRTSREARYADYSSAPLAISHHRGAAHMEHRIPPRT